MRDFHSIDATLLVNVTGGNATNAVSAPSAANAHSAMNLAGKVASGVGQAWNAIANPSSEHLKPSNRHPSSVTR